MRRFVIIEVNIPFLLSNLKHFRDCNLYIVSDEIVKELTLISSSKS